MQHGQKEDRKGIGTRIRVGNRERNCADNGLAALIYYFHHCSIFNQNQSISNLVIFEQNTKAIALLFGPKWLIFITVQSSIKINQFQIWSFLSKIPRL